MDSVLKNILPQVGILNNEENPTTDSDRVKAPVVGAGSTDFGGSQKHDVANQAGAIGVDHLAPNASQKTSDEEEGGSDASAAQDGSLLWRLWGQISENDKLEQHSLAALEQRMISIEEVVTTAKNIHTRVKNDHAAAMSFLRRILKGRQKNKEAKAAFQSELAKATRRAEGAGENSSKKRAANSPPDDSIGRSKKLSVGENRRPIIRRERLNSAPTTTSQRDRIQTDPTQTLTPTLARETPWEVAETRKTKRKKKNKEEGNGNNNGTLSQKGTRNQRPPRTRPSQPNALIIRAADGESYADILRKMKVDPKLKVVGESVNRVRKTAAGDLLLELQRTAEGKATELQQVIQGVLEEGTKVRTLQDLGVIEIKDLDVLTSKEEIVEAIRNEYQDSDLSPAEEMIIKSLRKAYGDTQTAVIQMPTKMAQQMIVKQKIRKAG